MAYRVPHDYITLDESVDLAPDVVESKLEFLLARVVPRARVQLDRCFYQAFTGTLEDLTKGVTDNIYYFFTETAMPPQFNHLAVPVFKILVAYAGSLGNLIHHKDEPSREQSMTEIKGVAAKVFKYDGAAAEEPRITAHLHPQPSRTLH
ncbi:hypothetical protein HN419_04515 [Candidatus Woesearchaeota archaeon]|jgi:hypothetical protein|nr:hypothetical protein [Candidatus Woesearchaeota archaeon]MBT3537859.1 hypothetical protein [Candidatus Woesearchaeota archaeon]MBT4697990.1 hypothetical protein [Candidatus Woesearchaeota archaeon]MBT4717669.1 hypothetical protein [Candidatus Woesearchaeota archaeon]MBT7105528.1 hypothetical protein [Candidatus Woesearchaeota archaeon]